MIEQSNMRALVEQYVIKNIYSTMSDKYKLYTKEYIMVMPDDELLDLMRELWLWWQFK